MMLDKRNIGLLLGIVLGVGLIAFPVRAQQMQHHGRGEPIFIDESCATYTRSKNSSPLDPASQPLHFPRYFQPIESATPKVNSQLFSTGTADPTALKSNKFSARPA